MQKSSNKSTHHIMQLLLFIIICILYGVDDQSSAFTLQLTHRYAPESPFYNATLTDDEIVEQLQNNNHKKQTQIDLNGIRPDLDADHRFTGFLVKVTIGTINGDVRSRKSYFLEFDTASELIWLECEDCKKDGNYCFSINNTLPYPNNNSTSYKPLPCGSRQWHPKCYPHQCIRGACSYHVSYTDTTRSTGILAYERFAFPTPTRNEESFKLVFGCGIRNYVPFPAGRNNKMAGVLGLGWGSRSLINQMLMFTQPMFSYCLPPVLIAARGVTPLYLRFGSDISSYSTLSKTRIMRYNYKPMYYVNLIDISVGGERLNIATRYLDLRDSLSGTFFDTGYAPTYISAPAYDIVKMAVIMHISQHAKGLEMHGPKNGFNLCYNMSKVHSEEKLDLPSITFHFENNADFVVEPEIAFTRITYYYKYDYVCFKMVASDDRVTRIGSDMQANHMMVYDINSRYLYFGQKDCSLGT